MEEETKTVESGGEEKAWLTSVPEEFRGHELITSMEKPGDVYKGYIDLAEKSKGMVAIPGDDADDETRDAFQKAMGRPDSVDGYEIERPELPEGVPYDEALEQKFKQTAFDLGLKPAQANKLAKMFNEYGVEQFNSIQKSLTENRENTESLLKSEWQGDAYKVNVEKARRAFEKFAGEKGKEWADATKMGDDPVFLKVFHQVYEAIGDDHFIGGSASQGSAQIESVGLDFSASMPDKK